MSKKNQTDPHAVVEAELRSRLEETEETLQAIRQYMVDAFVVNRENGIEVVTLNQSEIPYRMMIESMNEGAVTLISDGTIFYCNSCFGRMVNHDCEKLIGTSFRDLIIPEGQKAFDELFSQAKHEGSRGEFCLERDNRECLRVQLSVYLLGSDATNGIAVIATDISERVQAEEKIRLLSAELTKAEQEERQRISQILHDDLQQRLFAIKTQLSFLNNIPGDQVSPSVFSDLDQVQASLSEAIAITRNLSIDLSSIVLQGKGLTEAMTWLSFRMKEQYGLQVDLDIHDNFDEMDNHMRMLLFQAVRELLFNIVKHAGTLQANVTLEKKDGHDRILVTDKGKGFDVDAIMNDPQVAHGLLIIRDRLSLLGCRMEASSSPGQGTTIMMELP